MLHEYLERARIVSKFPSDRQLAINLGIKPPTLAQYRIGKVLPSDHTMIRLADLAGVPREQAILDLAAMRADSPESKAVYEALKKKLLAAALASVVLIAPSSPAQAEISPIFSAQSSENVQKHSNIVRILYIMENTLQQKLRKYGLKLACICSSIKRLLSRDSLFTGQLYFTGNATC